MSVSDVSDFEEYLLEVDVSFDDVNDLEHLVDDVEE